MTASTETLDMSTDLPPQALPYPANPSTPLGADSPKREAAELYLKSKALLESRREHRRSDFIVNSYVSASLPFYVLLSSTCDSSLLILQSPTPKTLMFF